MAAGPAVIGVRRLTHLPDGDEPPMSRRAIPKLSALGIVPKDDPMADTPRSCVFLFFSFLFFSFFLRGVREPVTLRRVTIIALHGQTSFRSCLIHDLDFQTNKWTTAFFFCATIKL